MEIFLGTTRVVAGGREGLAKSTQCQDATFLGPFVCVCELNSFGKLLFKMVCFLENVSFSVFCCILCAFQHPWSTRQVVFSSKVYKSKPDFVVWGYIEK